ncbi:hypothetical protein Scep_012441 [Stephania cephalantha]|uniref:Uncharacterized protein n=1 Tax=Stephania cephalantha TaxID=152367 RepID=A0AAP0JF60_9MAGN
MHQTSSLSTPCPNKARSWSTFEALAFHLPHDESWMMKNSGVHPMVKCWKIQQEQGGMNATYKRNQDKKIKFKSSSSS